MNVITETPTVKTVRLGPAADAAALPFTFLPGQFLNVTFSIGGARMNRSYSISSSPTQRAYLDLTVKREPRGAVSRHIADLLKVGDELEAGGPVGRFTFTGTEANSIVLISGGVGITPMMSISRYLSEQSWPNDIFFIYACRSPADFIFAKEIAELERHNPWLHVTVVMEHPDGTDWQGLTGRLNTDVLSQAVPHIASRRIHMCGPPVMMEAVRSLLQELKVPAEQIKTEDFGTAAPPPGEGSNRFAAAATGPLVSFSKSSKSAKIHLDQTLLELSEELNIGIEFSCRVGTCGICKVQLTAGEVDMAIDDALDADDKVKGIVLACQAKPKGPVTVEA
ncbi:2Fe-2S iron-sulfur cluster-binding protein [Pseudoduganella umbonata]|nr:2Fe-2S iron-sulfur cluster-binding protein [Pseudoduganella umbonata]QCP12329.1 2Fe-2S iron-sulfur cluster binding domain-containing protein [Pseudoduganella umbonata]